MNLGQAVAICLYELARGTDAARKRTQSRSVQKTEKLKPATAGDSERITTMLIGALRESGYLGQRPVAAKEEKIRRMVRRLNLSADDAEVWLGMLRQIVWKMKSTATTEGQ